MEYHLNKVGVIAMTGLTLKNVASSKHGALPNRFLHRNSSDAGPAPDYSCVLRKGQPL